MTIISVVTRLAGAVPPFVRTNLDILTIWALQVAFLVSLPWLSTVRIGEFYAAQPPAPDVVVSVSSYILSPISSAVFGFLSAYGLAALYYSTTLTCFQGLMFRTLFVTLLGVLVFPVGTGEVHGLFTGLSTTSLLVFSFSLAWTSRRWVLRVLTFALMIEGLVTFVVRFIVDPQTHAYMFSEVAILITAFAVCVDRIALARGLPPALA